MDLKAIKTLAEKHTTEELLQCANDLENNGCCACSEKTNVEDAMSDVLQALEVKQFMVDKNTTLQESVRAFSQRVRSVLTKKT
jgi:hypothetical protein